MLANHFIENIPNFRAFLLDHLLGALDRGHMAALFELVVNKRLEQLEGHLFRQSALMQAQFRTDNDNRTARIIDAFAEQVLAKAAGLAFEHVAQRFERTTILTGDRATTPTIVEQRVDGLLEHALLVADNHVRRAQFHEPF